MPSGTFFFTLSGSSLLKAKGDDGCYIIIHDHDDRILLLLFSHLIFVYRESIFYYYTNVCIYIVFPTMKLATATILLLSTFQASSAFTIPTSRTALITHNNGIVTTTQLNMFGGAGAGSPTEDDPAAEEQMTQAAAAMGMSVQEYKLAMQARQQLENSMNSKIVTGGSADTILVERDVNNPPKKFDITITEAGKALGRDKLSTELVTALKTASEASKKGRVEAQQEMLKWVQSNGPK